jgi:hypothetical membrane protein
LYLSDASNRALEETMVAAIVVFGLMAVGMLAIMLYGVFTEGRRR